MTARLVPNSISMVAQTAPPTEVTIYPGQNRVFNLMRIAIGSPAGEVDPTLGGEAHDFYKRRTLDVYMDSWHWREATLQTAGVAVNRAGALAVADFAETGMSEYIWLSYTLQDVEQATTHFISGAADDAANNALGRLRIPFGDQEVTAFSEHYLDFVPIIVTAFPAAAVVTDATDCKREIDPVAQSSYSAHFWSTVRASNRSWTFEFDRALTGGAARYELVPAGPLGIAGDTPTIRRPSFKSIDAKTISDRYNMGAPKQADYEFSDRKFYQ